MTRPAPDPNMLLVFSRAIQRFDLEYLKYIQEKLTADKEHPSILLVLEGEISRREIRNLPSPPASPPEP